MSLKMFGLNRTKAGSYQGRKVIPRDVSAEYQKLFGQRRELKFTLPDGTSQHDAKAKIAAWHAEIERRIKALRAAKRGEAHALTHKQAVALAGEWYGWFLAPYEESSGNPETWREAFSAFTDLLRDKWSPSEDDDYLDLANALKDHTVREQIRPSIEDWAQTAQFLTSRGMVLSPEAQDLFLDAVTDIYADAVLLLERRAKGDYAPDDTPKKFPEFARIPKPQAHGPGPWALFEQWIKEAKPALSTVNRWRGTFRGCPVDC
jgi:hypothetical protein